MNVEFRVMTGTPHAFHGGASFEAIGTDFADLARRTEVIDADVLDAWYPPAPEVVAEIHAHLEWLMKTSPPTHGDGLRAAIAAMPGLIPGHILLGSGTSSLMYHALPQLVQRGQRVCLLDPMYGEYDHLCGQVIGAEIVRAELSEADAFAPDPDQIAKAAQDSRLLIMVNPNSPTGRTLSSEGLQRLLSQLPQDITLWIDETYIDFAPGVPSAEPLVATDPRLIVCKSMSKFFGLSGLRVGYLAADPARIAPWEAYSPPWSVGLLAQVAAVRALQHYDYYAARAEETHRLRNALAQELSQIPGLEPLPSDTNFLLIRTQRPAAELVAQLRERNLFWRDCDSLSPRFQGRYVRAAVKDAATNQRMVQIVRDVMRG